MFKPGDRVRVVGEAITDLSHVFSAVGTVDTSRVDGYNCAVIFDGFEELGEFGFDFDELEAV